MSHIHTAIDRTPYTYLIGWKSLDIWYYGVQYGKNCHPSNLWRSYFTSSKHVKAFRLLHGEPDVVDIRQVFTRVNDARGWEDRVIIKMDMVLSERFLNRCHSKSIHPDDAAKADRGKGKTLVEKYGVDRANEIIQNMITGSQNILPWNDRKGDRIHGNAGSTQTEDSNELRRISSTKMWGDCEKDSQGVKSKEQWANYDYRIRRMQTTNTHYCTIKECPTCGKLFDGKHSQPAKVKTYCSNKCSPKFTKTYICISPENIQYTTDDLHKFCDKNILSYGAFMHVVNGRNKQHKGWTGHPL